MKNIKLLLGLLFSTFFFLGNTSFAAGTCELVAPESCYFVNEVENVYSESWLGFLGGSGIGQEAHCQLIDANNGASANKIDFSKFEKGTEICEYLKTDKGYGALASCTGKISVSSIQNIIKPFVEENAQAIWPDPSFELTRNHYNNYHKDISIQKPALTFSHWFENFPVRQLLECSKNGLLSDGKYGYCTRYALQLYLDQECLIKENPYIIVGNGIESKDEFDPVTNELTPEALVSDESLGTGSCRDYIAVFDKETGNAILGLGETAQFCEQYFGSTENCNIYSMAGNDPDPTGDYDIWKTDVNDTLAEQCSLLVLGGSQFEDSEKNTKLNSGKLTQTNTPKSWEEWGSDYEKPNGNLHDCDGNFTMVFNKDVEKSIVQDDQLSEDANKGFIKTQNICTELKVAPCSLIGIISAMESKNSEKKYTSKDNYQSLKEDISNFLKESCLDDGTEGFQCTAKPNLKIPGISITPEEAAENDGDAIENTDPNDPGDQNFTIQNEIITDWLFATSFAQESEENTDQSAEEETEETTESTTDQNTETAENIIFAGTEICAEMFKTEYCTIKQIRDEIDKQNEKNALVDYWDAFFLDTIKNIPPKYITEARSKSCKTRTDADKQGSGFDKCTRLALAKYLLAEKCTKCKKEPKFYEEEKYEKYQEYITKPNAKTPCQCGDNNFDYENMICPSNFFQWNEDQLRPKYLTGSNWESRKYRGDASDLTFWMQKLGNKITSYAAALAVLFIVYNGFMLVIAAGEEDQIKKAKDGMKWAAIGLIVLAFAYIIVKTVISLAY